MGKTFICCSCDEYYGGDALACAQNIASGTETPCGCDCHLATVNQITVRDLLNTALARCKSDYGCPPLEVHHALCVEVPDLIEQALDANGVAWRPIVKDDPEGIPF